MTSTTFSAASRASFSAQYHPLTLRSPKPWNSRRHQSGLNDSTARRAIEPQWLRVRFEVTSSALAARSRFPARWAVRSNRRQDLACARKITREAIGISSKPAISPCRVSCAQLREHLSPITPRLVVLGWPNRLKQVPVYIERLLGYPPGTVVFECATPPKPAKPPSLVTRTVERSQIFG